MPPQDVAKAMSEAKGESTQQAALDLVYQQQNNRSIFLDNGEYRQVGVDESRFIDDNVGSSPHQESDEITDLRNRRTTLPSDNMHIPGDSGWE